MEYNTLETVKVKVSFANPDEEKEYEDFRIKNDITPITAGELDFVRYKWLSAHFSKEDADKIELWLKSKKAKKISKMYL